MANSNLESAPRKPHPDYPLTPRGDGRWQKKIRGSVHYFTGTAQEALDEWLRTKDDLLASRTPGDKNGERTLLEICDRFLVAKNIQVDSGELKQLSWNDYKATCGRIVAQFGKTRAVTSLRVEDFEQLKASIVKTRGPTATGNEIQRVRVVFKYAYDAELIDRTIRFGPTFKRPSKKVLRQVRAAAGEKMIEAADVRRLIASAGPAMRAMILLAMNGGMGNSDVGNLPRSAVKVESGWCDFPRPKTGVPRRCPLWPETIDAIKIYLAKRPTPKTAEAERLVFVTKYGESWAKADKYDNPVTKEFRKLLGKLELHRPRLGFYTLRHVFRTIADAAKDQPAANYIMGESTMAGVDREPIEDDRLHAVADHVRAWLYPEPKPKTRPATKRKKNETEELQTLSVVG
jgi:integrase